MLRLAFDETCRADQDWRRTLCVATVLIVILMVVAPYPITPRGFRARVARVLAPSLLTARPSSHIRICRIVLCSSLRLMLIWCCFWLIVLGWIRMRSGLSLGVVATGRILRRL